MRPIQFTSDVLTTTLRQSTVATLPELASALGDCSPSTVYRKLKQLDYIVSYSHRGKYYALLECADFDAKGLWVYKNIGFSRHGTLRHSVQTLVEASPVGYRPSELNTLLNVRTIDILAELARTQQLTRTRLGGESIYCSADSVKQRQQMEARRIQQRRTSLPPFMETDSFPSAAMALFFSVLNEKHRRLFAGLLSLCLGHGGDQRIATLLGLNRKTIRRGRRELKSGEVDPNRIRKPGGGRPSVQKKNPEIEAQLLEMVKLETAGTPMGGVFWVRRSLATLAKGLLQKYNIKLSPTTVGKLLRACKYSPRVNWKCIRRVSPPGRDQQFKRIEALMEQCHAEGRCIVSVDTKKKELIGWFAAHGKIWCKDPIKVNDHDFRSDAAFKAVPYGIFDPSNNRGTVCIGDSSDTPRNLQWIVLCTGLSRHLYINSKRLVILADCGGSNRNRARAWKDYLQTKLCDPDQVQVSVTHDPSGASKWNPMEHRLFGPISINLSGRPLDSMDTSMNFIATTSNQSGLYVTAVRMTKQYQTGVKITDEQMAGINVTHSEVNSQWNYDLHPRHEQSPIQQNCSLGTEHERAGKASSN